MRKKIIALFAAAAVSMNGLVIPAYADEDEDQKFSDFMDTQFKETMESDYMTMHYSVKDWEAMGLTKPDLVVDEISDDMYEKNIEENNKVLDELKKFDYDALSDIHQHDYDAVKFACEKSNAVNAYPDLDFYFGPNGVTDNLITNFTEFTFYQKEDFDDYLTVLASVPDYLDDVLDLTKEQAEKGFFMTDTALDDVVSSIADFTAKTDDNELIASFDEAVDAFSGIEEAEKESYKEKNRDLVLNSYIPAYEKVSDELEKLKGSRQNDGGISGFENGQEYYAALAQYQTSTDETVQELFDDCTDFLKQKIEEYMELMDENQNNPFYENEQVAFTEPDSILKHLSENLEEFPDSGSMNYTAEYLDDSVANDTVVAYYVSNPVDDYSSNRIKINKSAIDNDNDLYVTLSHEGMPGHMYMFSYYNTLKPAYLRETMSFLGYTEGWAQYAETVAVKSSGLSEAAQDDLMLNDELNYVLDAAVDLAYNGLGYDQKEIGRWMNSLGLNSNGASSIITYVGDRAGMLLPYGIGMMKFIEYRDAAEEALGDSFDPVSYHQIILDNGPRTFTSVESDLNAYIQEKGGSGLSIEHKESSGEKAIRIADKESSPAVYYVTGGVIAALAVLIFTRLHHFRKDNPLQ